MKKMLVHKTFYLNLNKKIDWNITKRFACYMFSKHFILEKLPQLVYIFITFCYY